MTELLPAINLESDVNPNISPLQAGGDISEDTPNSHQSQERKRWQSEEDHLLLRLRNEDANMSWEDCGTFFPTRTPRAVRERYRVLIHRKSGNTSRSIDTESNGEQDDQDDDQGEVLPQQSSRIKRKYEQLHSSVEEPTSQSPTSSSSKRSRPAQPSIRREVPAHRPQTIQTLGHNTSDPAALSRNSAPISGNSKPSEENYTHRTRQLVRPTTWAPFLEGVENLGREVEQVYRDNLALKAELKEKDTRLQRLYSIVDQLAELKGGQATVTPAVPGTANGT